jgi:hypothetical protein
LRVDLPAIKRERGSVAIVKLLKITSSDSFQKFSTMVEKNGAMWSKVDIFYLF